MTTLADMTDAQFRRWMKKNQITGMAAFAAVLKRGEALRKRQVAQAHVARAIQEQRAAGISDEEAMAAGGPFPIVEAS